MAGAIDNSGAAQSVTAKDGMFVVNGQAMDLGTLMLSLSMEQTSLIDDQISVMMSQIQDQNDKLKALNELLTQMQSAKAQGLDDDATWSGQDSKGKANASPTFTISTGTDGQSRDIDGWMDYFGLTSTDVQYDAKSDTRDSEWDANIQAVQGAQSGLNSDSQLSMTQLQQLINARNTSYDMASNFLSTDQKSKDTITNNL